MAEQRSTPAGKNRGEAASLLSKARVADGVDPAVKPMQASR